MTKNQTVTRHDLTAQEIELIRLWRSTNDKGRDGILAVAKAAEGWRDDGFRVISGKTTL